MADTITCEAKLVDIVDHGRVFGYDHWYTFYCPECERQVSRPTDETECHYCGCKVTWDRGARPAMSEIDKRRARS